MSLKPAEGPQAEAQAQPEARARARTRVQASSCDVRISNFLRMSRRQLAEHYLPYVRSIAMKVKATVSQEVELDDLVEYGTIGLLEAADRFDPEHGVQFTTFAYYRIRGAIYDGLRGMGWLSRSESAKVRFGERANSYLQQVSAAMEGGHAVPANPFESAVQDLAKAVEGLATVYITSMDGADGANGGQVADDHTPSQEESLGLHQARALLRGTLEKLSDQEKRLVQLYYYREMSLQEVGEQMGLSKSWTCRLHARVITKLQRMLSDSF